MQYVFRPSWWTWAARLLHPVIHVTGDSCLCFLVYEYTPLWRELPYIWRWWYVVVKEKSKEMHQQHVLAEANVYNWCLRSHPGTAGVLQERWLSPGMNVIINVANLVFIMPKYFFARNPNLICFTGRVSRGNGLAEQFPYSGRWYNATQGYL